MMKKKTIKYTQKASVKSNSAFTDLTGNAIKKQKQNKSVLNFLKKNRLKDFVNAQMKC